MDDKHQEASPGASGMLQSVVWIALVAALLWGAVAYIGLDDLHGYVERSGFWGPLVLMLLKISTLVFAPLGGAPLYPIAGALFGPLYGSLYIFAGDVIGVSLCFAISRRFGRRVVAYFAADTGMALIDRVLAHMSTTRGLVEARVFFFALPEALSYAFGLTNISYRRFIVTHVLVYLVPTIAVVWLGDALVRLNTFWSATALIAVTVLALAGIWWFAVRARRDMAE